MRANFLLSFALIALPIAAADTPGPLTRLFALSGEHNILGESDFGIVNGYMTVGTPYRNAVAISRAFAPPYASSDFLLDLWLFGEVVPVRNYDWLPIEVKREGVLRGIAVTTRTVLVAERRGTLLQIQLRNTTSDAITVPLRFSLNGSLEFVKTWDFARPVTVKSKTKAVNKGGKIILANQDGAIVVGSDVPELQWESWSSHWAGKTTLAAGSVKTFYVVIAMDKEEAAVAVADEVMRNPEEWRARSFDDFENRLAQLFQKVPRLEASEKRLEQFYNRSLLHFLLTQWHVPEFRLHPHYGTGGVLGGTLANYLWDFGEPWELFPLYDPSSTKTHVKQFLSVDLAKHFSFDPMTGKGLGPFYPVNQEKIIGLVYYYVLNTGDVAFLRESLQGKTILQWVLWNATWGDDLQRPVQLIDYGNGNHHLELRRDIRYDHIVPDLNGRRYLNYKWAAALAAIAGENASYLHDRADQLKKLLRKELWDPQARWFALKTPDGRKDLRYTVQMFKLIGSPVLDKDQEEGLLSHLNEKEFLSEFGLHSMAKHDPAYDQVDFDNGGGGCFTAFPAQIAERLYRIGRADLAEELFARTLWWGSRVPYWGDSFAANYIEYRKDTPLQSTFDASAAAQAIIFGMFGIQATAAGEVRIKPQGPSFSPKVALRGVHLRGHHFDVLVDGKTFRVVPGEKTISSKIGEVVTLPAIR